VRVERQKMDEAVAGMTLQPVVTPVHLMVTCCTSDFHILYKPTALHQVSNLVTLSVVAL